MPETDPTGGAPRNDPPEPRPRGRKVECGYCGCALDADGEIISMGKRAQEFRAMGENDEIRIRRIDELEKALKSAIDSLRKYENDDGTPKVSASSDSGVRKRTSVMDALVPRS